MRLRGLARAFEGQRRRDEAKRGEPLAEEGPGIGPGQSPKRVGQCEYDARGLLVAEQAYPGGQDQAHARYEEAVGQPDDQSSPVRTLGPTV